MKQATTKVLTAHLPLPLADKVEQMAARLERSRGWIMKQALSAWIAQAKLTPQIGHVFPLDRAVEAYRLLEEGKNYGKVIVKIS